MKRRTKQNRTQRTPPSHHPIVPLSHPNLPHKPNPDQAISTTCGILTSKSSLLPAFLPAIHLFSVINFSLRPLPLPVPCSLIRCSQSVSTFAKAIVSLPSPTQNTHPYDFSSGWPPFKNGVAIDGRTAFRFVCDFARKSHRYCTPESPLW